MSQSVEKEFCGHLILGAISNADIEMSAGCLLEKCTHLSPTLSHTFNVRWPGDVLVQPTAN